MTTISFNHNAAYFAAPKAPRVSFAARLAALQASHEQAPHLNAVFGVAARGAAALVPFAALAWVFVTL